MPHRTLGSQPLVCDADFFQLGDSPLGWFALGWSQRGLARLAMGHPNPSEAVASVREYLSVSCEPPPGDEGLVDRVAQMLNGEPIDFSDVELDQKGMRKFQLRVIEACRAIPRGQVATYSQLAAAAGSPRAARAVGNVMASNRFPLIVPCHRVIAASSLGGFSARNGLALKRRLLALENAQLPFPLY
jgi:methylated-DNA-[protein]-cysteine S-methyltransferase